MSDEKNPPRAGATDLEGLAKRFQDLWQEQLAATAADPEFMEMMGKWMGALAAGTARPQGMPAGVMPGPADAAAWMAAMQQAMSGGRAEGKDEADDANAGAEGAKARPEAAAAASGAGDVAGDEFERRLADLEQRVERLEAGLGAKSKRTAARARRRKS